MNNSQGQQVDIVQSLQQSHHQVLDVLSQANAAFVQHTGIVNMLLQEVQKMTSENKLLKDELEKFSCKKIK